MTIKGSAFGLAAKIANDDQPHKFIQSQNASFQVSENRNVGPGFSQILPHLI